MTLRLAVPFLVAIAASIQGNFLCLLLGLGPDFFERLQVLKFLGLDIFLVLALFHHMPFFPAKGALCLRLLGLSLQWFGLVFFLVVGMRRASRSVASGPMEDAVCSVPFHVVGGARLRAIVNGSFVNVWDLKFVLRLVFVGTVGGGRQRLNLHVFAGRW